MTRIILLLVGIGFIVYAIAQHRRGRKQFYFFSYWNNLTPKGTAIYTAGLILIVISILFM